MNNFGLMRSPRSILFGEGQRSALGLAARTVGSRALICTDARLAADPVLGQLVDDLALNGITAKVFDATEPELPLGCVEQCIAACAGFAPDHVIGFGGGSCIDLAKLVATGLSHKGSLRAYYGENLVPGPVAPIIAIPTTAGTGSEVTPVAVVGDPERTLKVGVASPFLVPTIAICDPELTYSCPAALTASAGADALTHAIEAFTSASRPRNHEISFKSVFVGKNLMSDSFALSAIALIGGSLLKAWQFPNDHQARSDMMLGALYAGLAFGAAGTAAAHALQYPVGALTHTPHGLGVAALMPYVMELNFPAVIPEFAKIARALGVNSLNADDTANAHLAIEAVVNLFAAIGIPQNLQELGLAENQCGWVAEQSLNATRLIRNNPVPFDLEAARTIVQCAFEGQRSILRSRSVAAEGRQL